jgi:hypothetical protein
MIERLKIAGEPNRSSGRAKSRAPLNFNVEAVEKVPKQILG